MQVWIYEAFPECAELFGSRCSEHSLPRCSRWGKGRSRIEATETEELLGRSKSGPRLTVGTVLKEEEGEENVLAGCSFEPDKPDPFFDTLVPVAEPPLRRASADRHFPVPRGSSEHRQVMSVLDEILQRLKLIEQHVGLRDIPPRTPSFPRDSEEPRDIGVEVCDHSFYGVLTTPSVRNFVQPDRNLL